MKKHTAVLCSFVLLATCSVAGVAAAPAAAPASVAHAHAQKIRTIEGVTEYSLPNGLQVLLYPDEASTTVSVNVTYKVGSRHESYGETGMAHLLEHLNFKGTPRHSNIPAELSSHGANANATTSYDRTNYFETVTASDANLQWALEMESDRMVNSYIAQRDLNSEMTVVRNEFEKGENSPERVLNERVLSTAYLWHNYGHSTIGARADIEGVPIKRLQAFYHTYYQPDNATLIVAGKFDTAATLALIEKNFGAIPKPSRVLPTIYTAEPTQDGKREVALRRTGSQQILIEAFHATSDAHPDSAPLGLLAAMLNEQPNGLLYKKLVETKLAVSASVETATMYDPGYLMISVRLPADGDLAAVEREVAKVIETTRTAPFTQEQLDRVRNKQLNSYETLMNSAPQVADSLSENVAVGDWRLLFWDRDLLKKVTVQDTQRVANSYLVDSNLTVGTFVPEDKPVRAANTAAPKLDTLLAGYTGQPPVAEGEHFDATAKNIEARVTRGAAGSIKTAYLIKKTKGDRVAGTLMLQFGNLTALQDKADIAAFTGALLMRGTRVHSRQALQDELTRLKATLNVGGTASGATASFETTQANLVPLLKLIAEVLQQPAFTASDLDELKRASLARIESGRTDPNSMAGLSARRSLSAYRAGDFRYVPTFDEHAATIGKVTLADVQDFHKQFYGASQAQIGLVGNFDASAVTTELNRLFANWKSAVPYERAPSLYKATVTKTESIITPDKANAIYFAGANLKIRDDDPEYAALTVGNEIIGGGILSSRLSTRIRQKDGLSYGVSSQLDADSLDPVGSFTVYAITAPQNAAKVESDAHEELNRVLKDGYTSEEITGAKSGILQGMSVGRSSDTALAADLANHLYLKRDFNWDAQFEDRIGAVTADAAHKAVQRFIDPNQMITVKAGDFK